MKKDKRVVAVHKNGLGDYVISMKIRSQIDVSGVADLVKEMFEQSELYDIVKYNKPYFTVKRIDGGEEISQGCYEEPEEILSKPGQVFPSDRGYEDIENNHNTLTKEEALDKIREKIKKTTIHQIQYCSLCSY